ncbi:thiolase family protein [Amycolatopsis thermoflava]|uniref:thiolase family protein n=1 Tax=Amycolatopsis thermoflava TaxID=84480 RepID=UPI00380A217F
MTTRHAAVVGVGHSEVTRYAERPLGAMALDACRLAIADAGLDPADIDGITSASMQPFGAGTGPAERDGIDTVSTDFVVRGLGLEPVFGGPVAGMLGQSLADAVRGIRAGATRYCLVFRALHNPRGTYGLLDGDRIPGRPQYTVPYGQFVPGMFAQLWQRYQARYKTGSREQMATFVLQARENGLRWEHGYWTAKNAGPLTEEEYLTSPIVSSPLSVLDCDLPVQGAAAFVLAEGSRAADLPHPPAYVTGVSSPYHPSSWQVVDFTLDFQQRWGAVAARELWRDAGACPGEVDVANLYDGFSVLTMLWLEALGLAGEGEAFDFVQDGRIAPGGALPLNTAGGSLGAGRMHGVPQFMDSVLQVMGRSGPRQVPGARTALASIGPLSWGSAFLLRPEPPS